METKDMLKTARTEKDISLSKLESLTGIPKATLQRYETGTTKKIPLDAITIIEKALNLPSGYLMGWEPENTDINAKLLPPTITEDTVTFPILGEIAAGYDMIAVEDWSGETIEIPRFYLKGRPMEDYFVLRVHGDSMYPQYQDGDIVLILKQSTLNRSGEIGAVIYEDDTATLKKVEYVPGEDWMEMIPLNPEFKPKRIEGEALDHCRILGIPKLLIREI